MPLRPSYPIRTPRLQLRPLTVSDVEGLVAYRSLPDVCRYVPFEPMSAEDVRARIDGAWSRTELEEAGQALTLGVVVAGTGVLIGDVMLMWSSAEYQSAEIGYVFHPASHGHGFATEAAHALLHLAFDDLGLHRVTARVDAGNPASSRLLERLGLRQEAHLVENEWFKGRWSDELDFAILDREFRAQHAAGCPFEEGAQPGSRR